MADPLFASPETWTQETTAAVATGAVLAVLALCLAILRMNRRRRRKDSAGRQEKIVNRFQTASPLQNAQNALSDRDSVEARLAAVDSLKDLARKSPQDYWAVMEIFTTAQ